MFIVFAKPTSSVALYETKNPVVEKVLQTIDGPWNVSFDPAWGGPSLVTFDRLEDWSTRPEPGIRSYSGQATYRAVFDAKKAIAASNEQRISLTLGDVRAIARVKLNGTDLGVVWCPPWKLEVPADLLRPTGNELQITVANLWINRLIGDAGLPADHRKTITTVNPYPADAKLQPSGLLGPVKLKMSN
jgi:hypothetical protein